MPTPNLPSDPNQLALMFKADIESAKDGGVSVFQVQPDGRVKFSPQRGGGYVPPWTWAGTLPIAKNPDGSLTEVGRKLVTPGSDPSSAWNGMFEAGGPFRKQSQWNDKDGTYTGRIDWATLLGTIAAGGVIAGGVSAGIGGGSAVTPAAAPAASAAAPAAGVSSGAGLVGAGTSATTAAEAAAAAAATPGLASTTIGAGYIPAITGSTGSAVSAGAAGSSIPSYLKTLKDVGQTASDIAKGRAQGRVDEANLTNNANNTEVGLYKAQVDSNNAQNRYGLDAAGQENDFATKTYGLDLDTANQANRFGLDKVNAGVNVGNLELDQRRYALDAPGKRAGNSVRGDILANSQDVSFSGLPAGIPNISINGGLRPSMFSDNTRQLGRDISAQALDQQRKGDAFGALPTLPDYQGPTGKLPTYKAPAPYVNPPPAPTMAPQPQSNGVDTALNIAGYAGLAAPYLKYLRF